jgi:hypothetical protein
LIGPPPADMPKELQLKAETKERAPAANASR